jgi:hypothetical protein
MQAGNEHKKEKKRTANMIPLMIANNNGLTYEGLGIAFSPVIRYAFDIPLLRKNSYTGGLVQVQCLQCRQGVRLHHKPSCTMYTKLFLLSFCHVHRPLRQSKLLCNVGAFQPEYTVSQTQDSAAIS